MAGVLLVAVSGTTSVGEEKCETGVTMVRECVDHWGI